MSDFFKLSGTITEVNASELQDLLTKNRQLENFLYRPDILKNTSLTEYKIQRKIIKNASFSHTLLEGLVFRDCQFIDCRLIATKLKNCEFHNCSFIRTNVHKFSLSDCYLPPSSFKKCLEKEKHQNIGVHLYQTLMRNARATDQPEHEATARFYFLRWKRFQNKYDVKEAINRNSSFGKKAKLNLKIFASWVFEVFIGSGIRISHYVLTAIGLVLFFCVINFCFQRLFGFLNPDTPDNLYDAAAIFYYTVISLTTVGYGDITPTTTFGHIWISFQSVVGFVMFAILASMLFRKIAP